MHLKYRMNILGSYKESMVNVEAFPSHLRCFPPNLSKTWIVINSWSYGMRLKHTIHIYANFREICPRYKCNKKEIRPNKASKEYFLAKLNGRQSLICFQIYFPSFHEYATWYASMYVIWSVTIVAVTAVTQTVYIVSSMSWCLTETFCGYFAFVKVRTDNKSPTAHQI